MEESELLIHTGIDCQDMMVDHGYAFFKIILSAKYLKHNGAFIFFTPSYSPHVNLNLVHYFIICYVRYILG